MILNDWIVNNVLINCDNSIIYVIHIP